VAVGEMMPRDIPPQVPSPGLIDISDASLHWDLVRNGTLEVVRALRTAVINGPDAFGVIARDRRGRPNMAVAADLA